MNLIQIRCSKRLGSCLVCAVFSHLFAAVSLPSLHWGSVLLGGNVGPSLVVIVQTMSGGRTLRTHTGPTATTVQAAVNALGLPAGCVHAMEALVINGQLSEFTHEPDCPHCLRLQVPLLGSPLVGGGGKEISF